MSQNPSFLESFYKSKISRVYLSRAAFRCPFFARAVCADMGYAMLGPFLSAVALMLVLEGILPFLSPRGFRHTLAAVTQADDRVLRIAGLASMLAGALLLYLVRSA
jgi:uncharacterized protein YjeT (DUF2065 family)